MNKYSIDPVATAILEANSRYREFADSGCFISLKELVTLDPAARSCIKNLAQALETYIRRAEDLLLRQKMADKEAPISSISPDEFEFFQNAVVSSKYSLSGLASDEPSLYMELEGLFDDLTIEDLRCAPQQDAIRRHLRVSLEHLLDYAASENDAINSFFPGPEDFDEELLTEALVCIKSKYFQPSNWLDRARSTKLLLSNRSIEKFPLRIRGRIQEAFDCFVVGHYFACIATCRSLAEFVLVDRAKPKFGFSPYIERDGKRQIMNLEKMIEQVRQSEPDLADELDFVRTEGNRTLHPPKGREIDEFPPQQQIVQKCLHIAFKAIAHAYKT